ncbi:reductase [Microlunatus endophyticus]|uniref:Reductase n=1 Tax=Microlunatus endophyticus TaxID=1716077 RepID=A0A917SA49_9ACTN|nr:NAD-dependent epimerase/dehydratase family protein [Microlunatus endophyticus]GGL66992.1 reductase [Microlunatus endophyticus]
MRILILGGTAFLSAATARQALERGHQVTCLARGTTARPPEGAMWVRGDRDGGPEAYEPISDQDWDAVIDVAMQPGQVRHALEALSGRTAHWTFVSTISVYADDSVPAQDESARLHEPLAGDRFTEMTDYGPAKVACENAVRAAVGERAHVCRAGLIAGPGDRSDRVGYWPARFARGIGTDDRVLVPAVDDDTQLVDVDDLASWLLDAAERGVAGTFNATGEPTPLPQVLGLAVRVAGHRGRTIAVDPQFLADHGVGYWAGPDSLPLWVPGGEPGFGSRSIASAREHGLRLRPLEETLARVLDYERSLGLDRDRWAGLGPATEQQVLAAWREASDLSS